MNMELHPVPVPLFDDGQGGLRVTGTRVLLERIIHAFEDGATPEGIVQSYDTLPLADVYAVLTWYLRHKAEVENYLCKRAEEAEIICRMIEAKQPDRAELPDNPWLALAGTHDPNDPLVREWKQQMAAYRQEIEDDTDWSIRQQL